jgi:hypothetical protein
VGRFLFSNAGPIGESSAADLPPPIIGDAADLPSSDLGLFGFFGVLGIVRV